MKKRNKKGQITIFVILAVVIIAVVILLLVLTNTGRNLINQIIPIGDVNVKEELKTCITQNEKIDDKISAITSQGGSYESTNTYLYDGKNIEFLCLTNDNFKTGYIQNPLIMQHIETEIKKQIEPEAKKCLDNINERLKRRGYSVSSKEPEVSVELIPDKMIIGLNTEIVVSGKEETKRYNKEDLKFYKPSQLYQLIMLSTSILNFEARYGDSITDTYMAIYPEVKVDKQKQGDGTKVYLVSNRDTKEQFNFASRSLVFPAGYGE